MTITVIQRLETLLLHPLPCNKVGIQCSRTTVAFLFDVDFLLYRDKCFEHKRILKLYEQYSM